MALEKVILQNPGIVTEAIRKDKAKLHSNRAAALMMTSRVTEAQRECLLSIEEDPTYTRAFLRLGRLQVMMGDIEAAKLSASTARKLFLSSPSSVDSSDRSAVVKIETAIEQLEKLKSEVEWCLDVRDYSRALSHLQDSMKIATHSKAFQNQKGHILFQQKNYAQVVDYCSSIIRKQGIDGSRVQPGIPRSKIERDVTILGVDLCILKVKCLHYQNKVDDAMVYITALESAAPCSEKVIHLKRMMKDMKELKHEANALFKKGDFKRAEKVYTKALNLDPSHDEYCAVIHCNRAAALMGLQQYERALLDCDNALRRKSRYPRALLRRARCNIALKKYAMAISDFDRYLKENPGDAGTESNADIELERAQAKRAMEQEAEERQRKEAEQRRQRQQRQRQSKQRQQRQGGYQRYAWDDSTYSEDNWKNSSSSSGRNGSHGKSSHSQCWRAFKTPATHAL
ncbi:hypothetical protein PINS_up005818 [Pythium insidiosum]|nr:hypothetical protein PINS_up005818 [Pythium insidiosum]